MPSFEFNTGFTSWTPSSAGIANGTTLTFRAVGSGGDGSSGDYATNGGEGGGGGEFAEDYYYVSDNSESLNIQVAAGGSTDITYVETPALTYLIIANPGGNAVTATPGVGGTGGTGAITRNGGNGASGSGIDGGGGGGAAGDSSAGNNASGTIGGAGVTQFGRAGYGRGGDAGSNSSNGSAGQLFGGGGGGGGITGNRAEGEDGRVAVSWNAAAVTSDAKPLFAGTSSSSRRSPWDFLKRKRWV